MKFHIDQQELLAALRITARTLGQKQTPILRSVHLHAFEDTDTVIVTSTDITVFTQLTLQAVVDDPGAALVDHKRLLDLVKAQEKGLVDVRSPADQHDLVVGEIALRGGDPLEFPETPRADNFDAIQTLDVGLLREALSSVAFCASKDATRTQLQGVYVDDGAVVASDGKRIAIYKLPTLKRIGILPTKAIDVALRVLKSERSSDEVRVTLVEKSALALIWTDRASVFTRLIEGSVPDYMALLPDTFDVSSEVDAPELARAVKQVTAPLEKEEQRVHLLVGDEEIEVWSNAGKTCVRASGDADGKTVEALYAPRFLLDGLKVAGKQDVRLNLITGPKPLIMRGFDGKWTYGFMPLWSEEK